MISRNSRIKGRLMRLIIVMELIKVWMDLKDCMLVVNVFVDWGWCVMFSFSICFMIDVDNLVLDWLVVRLIN